DAAGARSVVADRCDGDPGRTSEALRGVAAEPALRELGTEEQLVWDELRTGIACRVLEPRLDDHAARGADAPWHGVERELETNASGVAARVLVDDKAARGLTDGADDGDSDRPGLRAAGERRGQVGGGNTVSRDHHHMACSVNIHVTQESRVSSKMQESFACLAWEPGSAPIADPAREDARTAAVSANQVREVELPPGCRETREPGSKSEPGSV